MKAIRLLVIAILTSVSLLGVARADTVSLTADPTDATGPAGSLVGWGFSFTNSGSDFAVITGTDFCTGVPTSPCVNSAGTYTDILGEEFLPVGPDATLSQVFDNAAGTGLGSFFIKANTVGTTLGTFFLSYDLYSVDPNSANFDPSADLVSLGNAVTAAGSVKVGASTTPMPEPRSLELLLVAGALLIITESRGRRVDSMK